MEEPLNHRLQVANSVQPLRPNTDPDLRSSSTKASRELQPNAYPGVNLVAGSDPRAPGAFSNMDRIFLILHR